MAPLSLPGARVRSDPAGHKDHQPLPRHRTGRGARRRERSAPVPAAAARRRSGPRQHRHRLQRHLLRLPREARIPRGGVRTRGPGVCGRPPPRRRTARAARPAHARARRGRAGPRRAAVRRVARPGAPRRLARPHRRRRLRRPRLRRGRCSLRPRPPPARERGRRAARPLCRRHRAGARRAGHRAAPGRARRPDRLRRPDRAEPRRARPQVRGPARPAVTPKRKPKPKKLVLAVIDALKPEMLDRAIEHGRAPVLAKLIEQGLYVRDCVSTFPSVTPVAASTIATGVGPDEHHIPAMNWYHRGEDRYVEYGSSFEAGRTFGVVRSLQDLVYNMNLAHLSRARRTVFEHLADGGLRSACTTYLIYRGRTRHLASSDSMYSRLARAAQFRHAVWGPDELFYADLFASRRTDCRSTLGLPGQRDQHSGCVGAHLVENDLFDFLLLSLPDNDTYSHKRGPFAQVTSIASADRALARGAPSRSRRRSHRRPRRDLERGRRAGGARALGGGRTGDEPHVSARARPPVVRAALPSWGRRPGVRGRGRRIRRLGRDRARRRGKPRLAVARRLARRAHRVRD